MRGTRAHSSLVLLACLAALALAGCAGSGSRSGPPGLALFGKPQPSGPRIETAADRIKALGESAKRIDGMPPDEQQRLAAELSQKLASEPEPLVRGHILRTLAVLDAPAAEPPMRAAMHDPDPDVRVACCDAWARRGGPQALDVLAEAVRSDADNDVRLAAARALGDLNDPQAVAALAPVLEDENPALQYRAVQSLKRVTGENFGNDVNAWRQYVQGERPQTPSFATRLRQWF
jgi:HEAT repeat protein